MTTISVDIPPCKVELNFDQIQEVAVFYLKDIYKLEVGFDNRPKMKKSILRILEEATTTSEFTKLKEELQEYEKNHS